MIIFQRKSANGNRNSNLDRFMFYVNEIVDKANNSFSTPDCMPYIKPSLNRIIEKSQSQIDSWVPNTNVNRFAHTVLYNIFFDLLCSGDLHIYRGQLDPLQPCDKLIFIVEECLEYAVQSGDITRQQAVDQKEMLLENIAFVG